ncbi:helix-turn-helix domain-containing protein [Pseudaestuariivita sp.]|uniref:helix-turn-helix domain-containing protein n=1 Tax=Pseudaestuariivita sp. TaxID=2211669 RepID=UPI004059C1BE
MSQALAVSHGEFGRAALYELDRPITTHAHREGHLIFYVSGARIGMKIGRSKVVCDKTTAAAISPWEPHAFDLADDGAVFTLTLYIKPMWFLEHSGSADFALNFGRRQVTVSPMMDALVRRLTTMMLADAGDVQVETLLLDLVSRAYEASWDGRRRPNALDCARRFSDFRVRRSQQLMKSYLGNQHGLDALASEVGLSRPHFFKLFKMQTGVTPNVYFNTLRSEQAIEDLTGTDKSVTDIAYDLGFASQASFTRFFSLNVGISPTDYRRVATVT